MWSNFNAKLVLHTGLKVDEFKLLVTIIDNVSRKGKSPCIHRHWAALTFSLVLISRMDLHS